MKSIFVFFIVEFALLGCYSSEKDYLHKNMDVHYRFTKGKIINIKLDSLLSKSDTDIQFYEFNRNKYLFLLNRKGYRLQCYTWPDGKVIKNIKLEKEGPDGVEYPNQFWVKSLDSVYILSSYTYTLFLINNNGKVVNKFRILRSNLPFDVKTMSPPDTKLGYSALPVAGYNYSGDIIEDERYIYLNGEPILSIYQTEDYYKTARINIIYDKKNKNVTYSVPFSSVYSEKLKFPVQYNHPYRAFNGQTNKSIFSFAADNFLYSTNLDGTEMKSFWAGSSYFDEVNPMPSNNRDAEPQFIHAINNYHYGSVYYNKYNHKYYRWVVHPMQFEGKLGLGKPLSAYNTSVILLDENLNRLGEAIVPKKYFRGLAFINSEGLYLHNPIESEDYISFIRVNFAKESYSQ